MAVDFRTATTPIGATDEVLGFRHDAPANAATAEARKSTPAELRATMGVEAGAQKNAPRIEKFASLRSDVATLGDGAFNLYNGSTQLQSADDLSAATHVVFASKQAAFGTDPSSPSVDLDTVDLSRLMDDKIANGTSLILAVRKADNTFIYIQTDQITRITSGSNHGYRCAVNASKSLAGTIAYAGYSIVAGSWLRFQKDVIDLADFYALLDASNLTAAFRSDVRGPWEPYQVSADQTRLQNNGVTSAAGQYAFTADPVLDGGSQTIEWRLDDTNYAEVVSHWSLHRRIEFADGVLLITGSPNELGHSTLQASIQLIEGTLPSVANATARPTIRGVPTWSDVREDVRASGTATDGVLVTEKAVRDAIPDVSDHIVASEFEESLNVLFPDSMTVTWASSVSNNDEAYFSTGNTGNNSMFGSTTFIAVLKAAGADRDLLDSVEAGDYVLALKGDSHVVMAKVAGQDIAPSSQVRRVWVEDALLYARGLSSYDEFPTGAGEVRFHRSLAAVAHSGSYNDLSDRPDEFNAAVAIGTTDTTATGLWSADDMLVINVVAQYNNETNADEWRTVIARFGDIGTTEQWVTVRGGLGGARTTMKRSGSSLVFKRHGACTAASVRIMQLA